MWNRLILQKWKGEKDKKKKKENKINKEKDEKITRNVPRKWKHMLRYTIPRNDKSTIPLLLIRNNPCKCVSS